MYNIDLNDISLFSALNRINNTTYVEVLIRNNEALFCTNTTQLYTELVLPCEKSSNTNEELRFRLLADIFIGMQNAVSCNVYLKVKKVKDEVDDDKIKDIDYIVIDFYDEEDRRICSSEFVKQETEIDSYVNKRAVVLEKKNITSAFDTTEIKEIVKVGKASASVISIVDGVANVNLPQNGRMFKKVDTKLKFSLNSEAFKKVLSVHHDINLIGNYVFAQKNGLKVLCTMSRFLDGMDYDLISEQDKLFTAVIDFSSILNFIGKFKNTPDSLVIDTITSECIITIDDITYTIDINISGRQSFFGYKNSPLVFSKEFIEVVLKSVGDTVFDVELTKHTIILKKGGTLIAVSRARRMG